MLGNILTYIVESRGKTMDFLSACQLNDGGDGQGPYIAHWNEAKLGPQPTLAELQAAEPAAMAQHEARRKIAEAEAQITPRRLREAVLTQAGRDWLAAQEEKIKAERGKL